MIVSEAELVCLSAYISIKVSQGLMFVSCISTYGLGKTVIFHQGETINFILRDDIDDKSQILIGSDRFSVKLALSFCKGVNASGITEDNSFHYDDFCPCPCLDVLRRIPALIS